MFPKVSPLKDVMRLGKRAKLALKFVGPFDILERIKSMAYQLAPPISIGVHNVFFISVLLKYVLNPNHILIYIFVQLKFDVSFVKKNICQVFLCN